MSKETCGAPKKDTGEPCPSSIGLCEECARCLAHCEHRQDTLKRGQRLGGHVSAKGAGTVPGGEVPPAPQTLQDAVVWAAWAARAAATGELDTARANSAARLLKEFRQALERSEAQAELEELREKIEELNGDEPELEALP